MRIMYIERGWRSDGEPNFYGNRSKLSGPFWSPLSKDIAQSVLYDEMARECYHPDTEYMIPAKNFRWLATL